MSLKKLKSNVPPSAKPITDSGEPINDSVSAFPSFLAGKFLLNDETVSYTHLTLPTMIGV